MDDMELYRMLGKNVARLRNEKKFTQAEIAAQIGLTRASLANIETGRQKVLMHHIFRLANALNCASILELVPPSFAFDDDNQTLGVHGSELNQDEHAQVERFYRSVGRR